jgi:hypothetical protein
MRFAKARRRSISANDHLISPDQRDNGGGKNSRSIPTMTHTIRQVHTHPVGDFSQAIADSDVSSATTKACPPLHVIYRRLSGRSGPDCRVARIVSFEGWHFLSRVPMAAIYLP